MASSRPLWRHARVIVTLLVALAVLPSAGLAWATWQLLDQDRGLVRRQSMDRLNNAALLVTSHLRVLLLDARRALAAGEPGPAGAIAITMHAGGVSVMPADRIAFLPVPVPLPDAPQDAADRGTASLARGRDLLKSGRNDAALDAFAEVRDLPPFSIDGVPSWMAARYLRGQTLERTDRQKELADEASRLHADMQTLARHLNGAIYQAYADDVERWSGSELPQAPVMLSRAIDLLWQRWTANSYAVDPTGHEVVWEDGDWKAFALWETSRGTLRAVAATRDVVDTEWMPQLQSIARPHEANVVLGPREAGTFPVVGQEAKDLPWPVTLYDTSGIAEAAGRRRVVVIGSFFTLVLIVALAVARLIGRELAVARQQSNFVEAVSHEFRTPLTSLKHFVELLREQPSLPDERRRECYDAQARAVDRLSHLVESLLDFGRLESGAQPYRLATQDCAALVRSVVDDFAVHVTERGYQIAVDTAESATVMVDAEAFSRALHNLLDNAVKYSPPGSTIEVGVRAAHGNVCIDVRDRGIGVGPGESRDIFRRFHRGAEARSRGIRGTGLGLAMVVEIMKAHGGRVDLESQPGQGSTFTLVFPAAA